MKKIIPFILIWTISMLFAEVFSWASQMWYINIWSLILAYPLYLFHTTFLLWIAIYYKKISLKWLYFLWVIFALYEAWVTKVLWIWYMDQIEPWFWLLFGLSMPEFPILVFFWHPIFSFILPILVYEILTKDVFEWHKNMLTKSKKKNIFIIIWLLIVSCFIAKWNAFNLVSANLSFIWTILIIFILNYFNKPWNIEIFKLTKKSFWIQFIYLILLYIITFIFLLQDRIPTTILPYFSLIIFYIFIIFIFKKIKIKESDYKIVKTSEWLFWVKDLLKYSIILLILINFACIFSQVSLWILWVWYFSILLIWIMIFFIMIKSVFFNN